MADKKLYRVEYTVVLYAYAEDEISAESAGGYLVRTDDIVLENGIATLVEPDEPLEEGWNMDCLVYSDGGPEATLGEVWPKK
jgi:hypothetical protein